MMSKVIKGVHHIAVKPTAEKYRETVDFYTKLLGMEPVKSWGDPQYPCLMLSCGDNTCMEILKADEESVPGGKFCHVAFATEQVDELIASVRKAGYPIKMEPSDVELGGTPCRVAFCYGPVGEEIEFFWQKAAF